MSKSNKLIGRNEDEEAAASFAYKLTAPRADLKAIRRAELLARILDSQRTRVVVLQAPAGHGKTTLLQQLRTACEERGDLTGWLSVDESDNDIHRFYQHLAAMVAGMQQRRGRGQGERAATEDDREYRADWLIGKLLHMNHACSIFLDDLHSISARQTLGLLREAVSHVPDNVQIYIASRTLPDLGLARLAVSEEALIVRAEDLCFTADETRHYFSSASTLHLTDEEMREIQSQTDGWPAALQLFRLALRNPAVRQGLGRLGQARSRDLTDYLAENVLLQQQPPLRDFLIRSSAMSRMSGALCDAVLEISHSEDHLLALENSGLFVRHIEGASRWFTYHPLFRAFLQDQLRSLDGAQASSLQERAGEWFLRNGYPEEAIEHFLDAGRPKRAAAALDQWSDRLIPAAHMMTVERWSERLPLSVLEELPDLVVKVVWALTFLRRYSRLAPLVAMIERSQSQTLRRSADPRVAQCMVSILKDQLAHSETIIQDIDVSSLAPSAFDAFQWGAVCNARGYAAMAAGEFAAAHEHLARSRVLSDPSAASFTWAYGLSLTGISYVAQGQLQESLTLHRTCMQDPRMYVDESIAQASLVASHVMALYEANLLADAEREFFRFRDVIAHAAFHDHLAVSYIAIARIYDFQGQHSKALEILDEAESISYASQWPRIGHVILWERVRRELVSGDLQRARALAERAEHLDHGPVDRIGWVRYSEEVHGQTIGRLRLKAICHDPDEALRSIIPVLNAARQKGRVYRQIKLLQLASIAHWRKQSESGSQRYLKEALQLAATGRYTRSFLEEGALLDQALRDYLTGISRDEEAVPAGPMHSFLRELAAAQALPGDLDAGEVPSGRKHPSLNQQFTKRELRILGLLATFASTQAMQETLSLSKDGLKFHLRNIYTKLGVNKRVDAIRLAKQMGL